MQVDIPTGLPNSIITGTSADGDILIGRTQVSDYTRAFLMINNTRIYILSIPETNSVPTGISADGKIIVGYSDASGDEYHAFYYDRTIDEMTDLGTPGEESRATAVSADGTITVGYYNVDGKNQACYWIGTNRITLAKVGEGSSSEATGVSENGNIIVGFCTNSNNITRACYWRATSDMSLTIVGNLGDYSQATAVSADGSVIIGFYNQTNLTPSKAFKYVIAPNSQIQSFGENYSRALAVSADGNVIVGFSGNSNTSRAFRYTDEEGMINLSSEELFSAANAVSADGMKMFGYYVNSDEISKACIFLHPFISSPPINVVAVPGNGSISISWDSPVGGTDILKYSIRIIGPELNRSIDISGSFLSKTIEDLINGNEYTIELTATNMYGTSVPSDSITIDPQVPAFATDKNGNTYYAIHSDNSIKDAVLNIPNSILVMVGAGGDGAIGGGGGSGGFYLGLVAVGKLQYSINKEASSNLTLNKRDPIEILKGSNGSAIDGGSGGNGGGGKEVGGSLGGSGGDLKGKYTKGPYTSSNGQSVQLWGTGADTTQTEYYGGGWTGGAPGSSGAGYGAGGGADGGGGGGFDPKILYVYANNKVAERTNWSSTALLSEMAAEETAVKDAFNTPDVFPVCSSNTAGTNGALFYVTRAVPKTPSIEEKINSLNLITTTNFTNTAAKVEGITEIIRDSVENGDSVATIIAALKIGNTDQTILSTLFAFSDFVGTSISIPAEQAATLYDDIAQPVDRTLPYIISFSSGNTIALPTPNANNKLALDLLLNTEYSIDECTSYSIEVRDADASTVPPTLGKQYFKTPTDQVGREINVGEPLPVRTNAGENITYTILDLDLFLGPIKPNVNTLLNIEAISESLANTVNLKVTWNSSSTSRNIVTLHMGKIFRKNVKGNSYTFENVAPNTHYFIRVFVNGYYESVKGKTVALTN